MQINNRTTVSANSNRQNRQFRDASLNGNYPRPQPREFRERKSPLFRGPVKVKGCCDKAPIPKI